MMALLLALGFALPLPLVKLPGMANCHERDDAMLIDEGVVPAQRQQVVDPLVWQKGEDQR